jgi:microcystin degradation protein MlrC
MKRALVESIRAVLPVDAVALDLHGAGVSEGCEDIESEIGRAVRELVGPDVKIVCSLDLHGNIHPAMTKYFDAFVSYRLYPHEDQ